MLKAVSFADLITFTRGSAAWYFDSSGVLQQAVTNVPRFDHDPIMGTALGLLFEIARTNSLRNNTMAGTAAGSPGTVPTNWILLLPTGITSQIVGFGIGSDGVDYVDFRWSGTASANGNILVLFESSTQVVASQGQTWTHSVYLRLVGGSLTGTGTFGANMINVDDCDASGNFLAGSNTAIAPTGAALASQRIRHTRTLAHASTARVRCYLNLGVGNGQTIDLTLRIGLPQLEQGAYASSPIKTSGTAVTRAADLARIDTLAISATAGTLAIEARAPYAGASGVNEVAAGFANTATGFNDVIYIQTNGGTPNKIDSIVRSGGAVTASPGATASDITVPFKAAAAWAVNDFALSINGGPPVTDNSGALPAGLNRLGIGSAPWSLGNAAWGGHIRRIRYFPRRVSNAELEQLAA